MAHQPSPAIQQDPYDALRAVTQCPLCHGYKDTGLVACWPCYRTHDMRNQLRPATRAILDHAAQQARDAR